MNKKIIQIEEVILEELVTEITWNVLDGLAIRFEEFQYNKEQEILLTRTETAEYLKINITTLWNWTKKEKLKAYGIGNRVYYKKSEKDESLIKIN